MTIFEKIIAREIPAHIVYEDDDVIAFLDINPVNKGHTLVVPKKQFENIFDADETLMGAVMRAAKKVANALRESTGATGVNLIMNNGEDADQDVFHAHLHVVPRFKDDGVFQKPTHAAYEDGEKEEYVEKIKNAIS